jgi:hypothetical protein
MASYIACVENIADKFYARDYPAINANLYIVHDTTTASADTGYRTFDYIVYSAVEPANSSGLLPSWSQGNFASNLYWYKDLDTDSTSWNPYNTASIKPGYSLADTSAYEVVTDLVIRELNQDTFTATGATILDSEPFSYTYTGLVFKPNDPVTNSVSWTQFVATKGNTTTGSTSVTVSAGSASWTSGILYFYYIPGNSTLQTGTNLVSAISAGGRILATYKGGTDLTSDEGKAFTSGDMVLAGTIGASQLVTNTAIITSSAQIGADIQSQNYSPTTNQGWIIQQNGYASFTNVNIYNQYGELILSSGQQVQGATFGGRSFTAGTLTLSGTANISGNSINKI